MDNIMTWTGLSVEESIRMTKDRDKWRKYAHGVANPDDFPFYRFYLFVPFYWLYLRVYDTIRYDTKRYFNMRSKADMSQLNLPHGTNY